MKEDKSNTDQLNHKEAYLFHKQNLSQLEQQGGTDQDVLEAYRLAINAFEETWSEVLSKRATQELKQANRQRRRAYACFAASVKSGKSHPDSTISDTSRQIEELIDQAHGLNSLCSLSTEIDFMHVIDDIKKDDWLTTLSTMGALSWLEELELIEAKSKDVQQFHLDEMLNGDLRAIRKKRKKLEKAYLGIR